MQSVVFIIRGLGLTQPTSEAWPTRNPKYPHSEWKQSSQQSSGKQRQEQQRYVWTKAWWARYECFF